MGKPKSNKVDEEYLEDTDNNDNYEYQTTETGERTLDKPTLDKLFDVRAFLKNLEKQFKGFVERDGEWKKVNEELARDWFIDNTLNGLRAIITEHNIYTWLSEQDAESILREENEKFIKAVLNERSIKTPTDRRFLVELYDHALQSFMGLPTKGHGSVVLRDVSGGLSQGNNHLTTNKTPGFFSELSSILSFKNKGVEK